MRRSAVSGWATSTGRTGHHIWYFKGVPSRLGYLLDLAPKDLEKVIYFAAYMITSVDEEARHRNAGAGVAGGEREEVIAQRRDDVINKRMAKLEEDLAALEAAREPAAVLKKTRDAAEKEMSSAATAPIRRSTNSTASSTGSAP